MTTTVTQAIYRMKVEGKETVDAAARSVDGLAVSEEKATRATRATQQSWERFTASLDPAIKAHQRYQQSLERVERFTAAGIGSDADRARAVEQITARYQQALGVIGRHSQVVNDNSKRVGLNAHEMKNLGFQINDIATMLAMGSSPFQILASQGGQVYQILAGSQGGVTGALKDMAARLAAFLGPLGLFGAGLAAASAAAYGLYSLTKKEAPTLEKTLAEQARLIGLVKDAYRDAANSAGKFYTESKAVLTLQTELNINNLQQALREQSRKINTGLGTVTQSYDPLGNPLGASFETEWNTKFSAFRKPIEALIEQARSGVPDLMKFREEVAKIGQADPGAKEKAGELLEMSQAAATTAEKLQMAERALRLLQGKGSAEDREGLGLSNPKSSSQINAYDQLIQRTKDRIEQLELEAQTAGKTGSAIEVLRIQQQAELAARKAGVPINQQEIDNLKARYAEVDKLNRLAQVWAGIEFDKQMIGLSEQDVRIVERLRDVYEDIPTALASSEANALRFNRALRASSNDNEKPKDDERDDNKDRKVA